MISGSIWPDFSRAAACGARRSCAKRRAVSTTSASGAAWLAALGRALTRSDVAAAVALFDDESSWRDLVSFTWNITTLEGKDSIAAMLQAPLSQVKPSGWAPQGEATTANGVAEGWFT